MAEQYEYKRFELDRTKDPYPQDIGARGLRKVVTYHLQPLGNDGWEIMLVGDHGQWVEARKALSGVSAPASWEYAAFIEGLFSQAGDDMYEHLKSRGWIPIKGPWLKYHQLGGRAWKRSDVWKGSDDGDIILHLEELWPDSNFPFIYSGELQPILSQVLKVKWELSERAGHDVGTLAAVKYWLENR